MKEIISAVIVVVNLWAGTFFLQQIYDSFRKAALEKAARGLPSLQEMNRRLRSPKKNH